MVRKLTIKIILNIKNKTMAKEKIKDLKEMLIHELRDLYSAESQLSEALPKVAKAASNDKLKKALDEHYKETLRQKERLEQIGEIMDVDLSGMKCNAMEGLIEENEDLIKADAQPDVKDAGLIAGAQKIEHYEIASYGTCVNFAERLGFDEVADLLAETLEEEKQADSKLNRIALKTVNVKAEAV